VLLGYAEAVQGRQLVDDGDTLLELTPEILRVAETYDWAVVPSAGAVVMFSGTARDHSEGRDGVETLAYEAYDEAVLPALRAVAAEIRKKWHSVRRLALVHRVGDVPVGESSVLVVVSAPHRPEAFAAARFGIDALKATAPIWKRETWKGGDDWAKTAQHITDLSTFVADHDRVAQ
jgi:molybdopterin synthase catalytic subunit